MSVTVDRSRSLEQKLELVAQTGLLLARNTHLESIVQRATDTGLQVTGAEFARRLQSDRSSPRHFSLLYRLRLRPHALGPTFPAHSTVAAPLKDPAIIRSRDIGRDTRFRGPLPADGLPHDARTIRSYLAVPVSASPANPRRARLWPRGARHLRPDLRTPHRHHRRTGRLRHRELRASANSSRRDYRPRSGRRAATKTPPSGSASLAAIIESSDDAIISKDLNGDITSWNPAADRILGYTADEMIGDLRPPSSSPRSCTPTSPCILVTNPRRQRIEHFETIRITKDGRPLDVSLSISPVKRRALDKSSAPAKILRDSPAASALSTRSSRRKRSPPPAAWPPPSRTRSTILSRPCQPPLSRHARARQDLRRQIATSAPPRSKSPASRTSPSRPSATTASMPLRSPRLSLPARRDALRVYSPRCSADNSASNATSTHDQIILRPQRRDHAGHLQPHLPTPSTPCPQAAPSSSPSTPSPDDATRAGVVLTVEDNGIGIPEEHTPHLRRLLHHPQPSAPASASSSPANSSRATAATSRLKAAPIRKRTEPGPWSSFPLRPPTKSRPKPRPDPLQKPVKPSERLKTSQPAQIKSGSCGNCYMLIPLDLINWIY